MQLHGEKKKKEGKKKIKYLNSLQAFCKGYNITKILRKKTQEESKN